MLLVPPFRGACSAALRRPSLRWGGQAGGLGDKTVISKELPSLIIQVTEIYNFAGGTHSGVLPFARVRYNHVDVIHVTVMAIIY